MVIPEKTNPGRSNMGILITVSIARPKLKSGHPTVSEILLQ
jgi:hypothetical protein